MVGIIDTITGLFRGGDSLRVEPLYSLRHKLIQWRESGNYPSYFELPSGISFDVKFWTRVQEIYRHTKGDGHERTISVWYVDGDFVLTENIRGKESSVTVPRQKVSISYKPIKGTTRGERMISVNGKVYAKRTVDLDTLKKASKQKVEITHLLHMHTHPPHTDADGGASYSFFSPTDIRSFLSSRSALAGLVTDKLWLIAKTAETPRQLASNPPGVLTPDMLTDLYKIKVYTGEFGRSVIVVRPEDGTDR